jgi:hypothetical protein
VHSNELTGKVDSASTDLILQCAASYMSLPLSYLSLIAFAPVRSRRLTSDPEQPSYSQSYTADILTNLPIDRYPQYKSQPTDLFTVLSNRLSTSVDTGAFAKTLHKLAVTNNVPAVAEAVVSNSTYKSVVIIYPPTFMPTGAPADFESATKMNTLEIIGVIIGSLIAAFVFLLLVHGFVRYLGQKNKKFHFANICTLHCCCCSKHARGPMAGREAEPHKGLVRGNPGGKKNIRAQSSFMLNLNRIKNTGKRNVEKGTDLQGSNANGSSEGGTEFFQLNDAELDKWLEEIKDIGISSDSVISPIKNPNSNPPSVSKVGVTSPVSRPPIAPSSRSPKKVPSMTPPMATSDDSVASSVVRRVLHLSQYPDDDEISLKSAKLEYVCDTARI